MTETAILGTRTRPAIRATPGVAIPVLSFLLFLAAALHLVQTTPFPANDELEHVSYAAWLQENARALPRFEEQRTLYRDDFTRWDWRPNYVGHPSPFYVLIARVLDRTAAPDRAIILPRLVSLSLLAAGVALVLAAGARVFAGHLPALLTFSAAVVLCPQLLTISGMVTNDSLAFLGGALAAWGLATARRRPVHDAAAGAGLMLALWAKPNAGVEVGLMLAAMLLLSTQARPRLLAAAIAGGLAGLVPVLPLIMRYGAVVPVTAESVWDVASIPDPAAYLPVFLLNLGNTWGYLRTGAWPLPAFPAAPTIVAVAAMIAAAAWGAVLARRNGSPLAAAGLIAAAAVLPIHAGFAATRLGGSLPAAAFRYDLPLWPAFAFGLAAAILHAPRPAQRAAVAAILAAALATGWLRG